MEKTELMACPMTADEAIRILTESSELLVGRIARVSELIGKTKNAPERERESWYDSLDHCQREYDAVAFAVDHLRRTAETDTAMEDGRLVELSEPMIPMMAGDDPMDTDVYCPRCEYDLSGAWIAEHPEEWKLCQCPNCGQSINDCIVISRQEAEAALSERGGEDG